jgi:phosphate transport system substrate-binding protein
VSPTEADWDLHEYLVARDGVAILVNRENGIDGLTLAQVGKILDGEAHSWKDVGGDDAPIDFIDQQKDDNGEVSRTHKSLVTIVLGRDDSLARAKASVRGGAMEQAVAADRNAVGFVSLRDYDPANAAIKAVKIQGVPFTSDTLLSGRYPLMRSFYLAVFDDPSLGTPSPLAKELVEFTLSKTGQDILRGAGLVGVSPSKTR